VGMTVLIMRGACPYENGGMTVWRWENATALACQYATLTKERINIEFDQPIMVLPVHDTKMRAGYPKMTFSYQKDKRNLILTVTTDRFTDTH